MTPLEILVIGLPRDRFSGQILPELRGLRGGDDVRLVDLLLVSRDEHGALSVIKTADPQAEGLSRWGEIAPLLAGLAPGAHGATPGGDDRPGCEDAWNIAADIPPGSSAVIAVVEHRWASGLRDAVEAAGGVYLVDDIVHPDDVAPPAIPHPAG